MKTMQTLRAALLATAISIGMAVPALAISPTVETDSIDVTFRPPALSVACGFEVTRHVAGSLTIRTFLDSSGDFRRRGRPAPDVLRGRATEHHAGEGGDACRCLWFAARLAERLF
jgi:hypothetical protein